jgi:hypothetical protein
MARRNPPNAAEAKRIAALEAQRMEAARQESIRIREEALDLALASIDKAWRQSDSRSKDVKALAPSENE